MDEQLQQQQQNWQRRWHPLLQEWVLIAANTQNRPITQGQKGEDANSSKGSSIQEHELDCYLCPNVTRASGNKNPNYKSTYVFENDFPSLSKNAPTIDNGTLNPLEKSDHLQGECRVVCFNPQHNIALAELPIDKIIPVFSALKGQFLELSKQSGIENILMFENKGKETGASNTHPHGQIYATPFIPKNISIQEQAFNDHRNEHGSCLLCNIIINEKERIVIENEHFIVFVPFFARFAYECMLVPKNHCPSILNIKGAELESLAEIYKQLMQSYDKLFGFPFPNIISWINSALDKGKTNPNFHCYLSFCPPLRSPTQLKYLAGFETAGGNIVNPLQPEVAAQYLREALP